MLRFLDRFYRVRLLLAAIGAIVLTLSIGFAVSRPRSYEAIARVWVDTSIQGDHATTYVTASEVGDLMLGELLQTRAFCLKVARRSQQASGVTAAGQPDDDQVYQTLSTHFLLSTAGPNVITVSFADGDPRRAAATTQAVVDLFKEQVLGNQADGARATVTFYQQQVKSARDDLARADGRIADYLGGSGDVSAASGYAATNTTGGSSGATTDVTLMGLQRDDDALRKQTDDLVQKLNQAQLDLNVAQQSAPNGYRVVDQPIVPRKAVSRTKPLLIAGVGGLGAGALLSLLVLIALTGSDSSLRYSGEVEAALGLRLVGTIPRFA
jgi:uncharacterized protein involved in exopolysaccharide biosynthesis